MFCSFNKYITDHLENIWQMNVLTSNQSNQNQSEKIPSPWVTAVNKMMSLICLKENGKFSVVITGNKLKVSIEYLTK